MKDEHLTAMLAHRAKSSLLKREAVLLAIDEAADWTALISVAAIARHAGVSREFIHSHPELREKVRRAVERQDHAQQRIHNGQIDLRDGRSADRSTLIRKIGRQGAQIEALTTQVRQLESARARYLGDQLLALDESAPVAAVESLVTTERLTSENQRLQRELDEALALTARLRNELGGARQALAEALAESGAVTPIPMRPAQSD